MPFAGLIALGLVVAILISLVRVGRRDSRRGAASRRLPRLPRPQPSSDRRLLAGLIAGGLAGVLLISLMSAVRLSQLPVPAGLATAGDLPGQPPPAVAAASLTESRAATGQLPAAVAPLRGLSGWVDLYDYSDRLGPGPAAALADEAADHGVQVLWVQTSRYNTGLIASPGALAALVDRAKQRGMAVVAWTLPELAGTGADIVRAQAAGGFRTTRGGRFDAVGLDIEVASVPLSARNDHLVALAQRLHGHLGVPLYAIVPPPIDLVRRHNYWPVFPWRPVAANVDGLVTMGYWTDAVMAPAPYTAQLIADVHRLVGDPAYPLHTIGGLAALTSPGGAAAFCATARQGGALGAGLYDVHSTPPSSWSSLAGCRS